MEKIIGLNSLRFFSFLAIFLFHTTPYMEFGYLGVEFFFVLSSFLLTYLALKEIELTNTFSRLNFFMRRALRIFPLYYFILIFSFYFLPIISTYFGETPNLPQNQWLYWFLLSNYENSDCIFSLKFLWSIAVEEQFYLLFIALSFLLIKNIRFLISLLILSYIIFIIIATNNNLSTYLNTFSYFPNFAFGMLGGYLFYKKKDFLFLFELIFFASLIGTILLKEYRVLNIFIPLLFACTILITVKYASFIKSNILFKITEKLGKYTYGLYVYSGLVIIFVSKMDFIKNEFVKGLFEFFLLLLIAFLSYHIYEKQFLKFKKHFR